MTHELTRFFLRNMRDFAMAVLMERLLEALDIFKQL